MKTHPRKRASAQSLLSLVLICLTAVSPASADNVVLAPPAAPDGKVVIVKLFTTLLKPLKPQDYEREVDIYLPSEYFDLANQSARFPVLYLLHGSPGNPYDFVKFGHWQALEEQFAAANTVLPPILAAPDGNYAQAAFGDSEWLNSADTQNKFEDFIVDDVVPYIDNHYRTIAEPEDRVIGGVSEGGYGAVNIALHNPTIFSSVIALSGYYTNDGSGWARRIMGHDRAFLAYNSPLSYIDSPAAQSKSLSAWQKQRYFIGSGVDEKPYTAESQEMSEALENHSIDQELCELGGKHGWELWNPLFVKGLDYIFLPNHPTGERDTSTPQPTQ